MAPENKSIPPIEIPWKLVGTTQVLKPEGTAPDAVSISIFSHVVEDKQINEQYPDEQLVYFRFSASLSPMFQSGLSGILEKLLANPFNQGYPTLLAKFDISLRPKFEGNFPPYFLDASPVRRTMLESGIVGVNKYEGENRGLSVGKSGSQLHESFSTSTETSSESSGWDFLIYETGDGSANVNTSGSRNATERVDVMNRNAQTERQDLLSHMTEANNVLSLLVCKHIGSSYLNFALRPLPLRQLSVDSTDPYLWYHELLKRQSFGLDGIQDFYAIAVVKKNQSFCIEAKLSSVHLIDNPPSAPECHNSIQLSASEKAMVLEYLCRKYPVGTQIDELDLAIDTGDPRNVPPIKIVAGWKIDSDSIVNLKKMTSLGAGAQWDNNRGMFAGLVSFIRDYIRTAFFRAFGNKTEFVPYKAASTVFIEMQREKYESELRRSPIERGVPFERTLSLETCFRFSNSGDLELIAPGTISFSKPEIIDMPLDLDLGPYDPWASDNARNRNLRKALSRINDVESKMASYYFNSFPKRKEFNFEENINLLSLVLNRIEGLSKESLVNESLEQAGQWLGLSSSTKENLKSLGVTDLRSLADAINNAALVRKLLPDEKQVLSSESVDTLKVAIAKCLKGLKND